VTIVEFIEARLAEDEETAQSAIDPERPGTHWCWEDGERDPLQPGVEVEGLDTQAISLRTVEEYPTRHVGPLPAFILRQVEARQQGGLWHIARHDPARVLQQCEFGRDVLDAYRTAVRARNSRNEHATNAFTAGQDAAAVMWLGWMLQKLAAIWSDHPDYRTEWAA
jgi:hypothetical protein